MNFANIHRSFPFSLFLIDTMVVLAHLLTTVICLSSLSTTLAATIPPQKRAANGTCCGYYVENRDGFFRFKHEIDFSTLTSIDKVYEAGWEVSHGWQAGGKNEITGQIPMADEKNVELIKGQGLRLKVPRTFACIAYITSSAGAYCVTPSFRRPGQERENHLRRRNFVPRPPPRRCHRNDRPIDQYCWNLHGNVHHTCRWGTCKAFWLARRAGH